MSTPSDATKVQKTDAEWRSQLTPEQYRVTRRHGTERAYTSPLNEEKRTGTYTCVCCGEPLFRSEAKFESGTGWPSFFEPIADSAVEDHEDRALFMRRTENRCARCDAHLGHVFPDGPRPTGLRYCMNGTALNFEPDES
ncbi:peptide-methionine (R)-S-oxide reductase MsrB [Acuticoccus sp. I52.16.1]|uniref:peptide-methionine (R)-S-oxide reductase MsrB n=1 Tax=Acuticoccus sp. I52.16.1 TaxID=2928472 RepID=UPI001FD61992|nr:peptide-methionine (R)-S-oxide reductase MsrB [Acuticoccus sp. I52.16.1]UOM34341.1 peptide-methionine (R)-S-oxide reductase MsrB [Acuticoccus sp. I52.16.1]